MRNGGSSRGSDADTDADADAMQVDGDAAHPGAAGEGPSAGWTVRGIVKKKIVFSKRPMPVMGKKLAPS